MIGLLDGLLHRGKRIGVVSNCFAEDVTTWPESLLATRVHSAVFSFDVRLAKPDPAIYREAIRRLGVTPEATVFIGDGADNELTGAMEAGLRAFRALWFLARWDESRRNENASDWALQTPADVARVVA